MTSTHPTSTQTDRAVSPVIGVILMVAITVVLAGVIGVMVFGLADDLGDTTPSATLDIDDVGINSSDEVGNFTLAHDGGDAIEAQDLSVIVAGSTIDHVAELSDGELVDGDTFSAGESVTIVFEEEDETNVEEGDSITVTHAPSDSVLATYDIEEHELEE